MHQPFYKDVRTGRYTLPWVRLHAVKDYLHMAEVLARYPDVRATFNFVPSLVEQIEDYAAGRAEDEWEALSRRERFTDEDKRFLLGSFFSISWDRFVRRYPRYWQLLQLRNQVDGAVELLSDAYWRDLTAWFNLAWIEPTTIQREPELARLVEKGRNFDRQDVETILAWHRRICGQVLPIYRDLQARGQVELSTSPYFHPILPLLVDTRAAREATPHMALPNVLFHHPEDAAEQLRMARAAHGRYFGAEPRGLWPSEGAVSHRVGELLTLNADTGAWDWAATDESILAGSIGVPIERDGDGNVTNPSVLYQPYRFGDSGLSLIFRDRVLSDRIGFVYRHFGGRQAAEDLVGRLHCIADRLADDPQPYLVPIILDGENCWEEYPENGNDFLHALYELLGRDERLRTVRLCDHVREHPPRARIERLRAGSWIFGNLETWIGEEEQNRAWEYLAITRARLVQWQTETPDADPAAVATAWRALYTAEGSDWFWWYYSRNKFGQEQMFDREFRSHLGAVYAAMGLPAPPWIRLPISGHAVARFQLPSGYVSPRIGAAADPHPDWTHAGYLDAWRAAGVMQQGGGVLRRLYYGYSPADLYFRIEANEDLSRYAIGLYVRGPHGGGASVGVLAGDVRGQIVPSGTEFGWQVCVLPRTRDRAVLSRAAGHDHWEMTGSVDQVAIREGVAEVAVPFERLGLSPGAEVSVVLVLARDGTIAETLPAAGDESETLTFTLAAHG